MRRGAPPERAPRSTRALAGLIDSVPALVIVAFAMLSARRAQGIRRAENPGTRVDWSQIMIERQRRSNRVAWALAVAMEALRACGRSPGQRLLGLTVLDAETGATVGMREALTRTLALRSTTIVPRVTMWLLRRNEAQQDDAAAAVRVQVRDAAAEHRGDPAGTRVSLKAISRENPAVSARGRAMLLGLGASIGAAVLKRLMQSRMRQTTTVSRQPSPRSKRRARRRARPGLLRSLLKGRLPRLGESRR